jgi:hypothetical protein
LLLHVCLKFSQTVIIGIEASGDDYYRMLSGLPGQENEARINLACKHATALFSDGRFNEAESYFNDALQSWKEVLG